MITTLLCLALLAKQDDIADVKIEDRYVGGDHNKRYFFIDAQKPDDSKRKVLLLILPGGDGSADFHSFCQRVAKFGLPNNWIAAERVAPVWSTHQAESLVWPTASSPYSKMKFTTEDFMSAVIADVKQKTQTGMVFALGWSSGGPPVYAAATEKASPLNGAFVAMSIGPKSFEGSLAGKRFFILHSPEDKLIDIGIAQQARDTLQQAGASVRMMTYPGGHGWSGDVYGNIATGATFLEKGWKG